MCARVGAQRAAPCNLRLLLYLGCKGNPAGYHIRGEMGVKGSKRL
jgi:hypothetical protein